MNFDINTKEVIKYSAKLGQLHRSALPVAVRGTLNQAAFETKKNIPKTASRKFVTRNRSFFRAFSSVNKAGGFDINAMTAAVGINVAKGSKVAEGLEKQETGGTIRGRKLIPHDKARVSGSHQKRVRAQNRFSKINKIQDVRKSKKRRGGKYILIKKGGKGTVFEVKKTGKRSRLIPLYHYRNTRLSRVRPSPFMKPASILAQRKMPQFYAQQMERQIKRLAKK